MQNQALHFNIQEPLYRRCYCGGGKKCESANAAAMKDQLRTAVATLLAKCKGKKYCPKPAKKYLSLIIQIILAIKMFTLNKCARVELAHIAIVGLNEAELSAMCFSIQG